MAEGWKAAGASSVHCPRFITPKRVNCKETKRRMNRYTMRWQRRWWDVDEVAGQASKLPISCFLPFPLHLFHSLSVLPWRLSGHWTWGCTELKSNVFQILKMHQPMPLLIFDFSLASPYNFFSHSFSTSSFFQYFFFHLDSFHSHLNGFAWNCPVEKMHIFAPRTLTMGWISLNLVSYFIIS